MKVYLQLKDGSRKQLQRISGCDGYVVYIVATRSETPLPQSVSEPALMNQSTSTRPSGIHSGQPRDGHSHAAIPRQPRHTTTQTGPRIAPRTPRVPPSGNAPNMKKKIWCSHWIKTGGCAFGQQGCLYKHEMPDLQTLQDMLIPRVPHWYRQKLAEEMGTTETVSRLQNPGPSSQTTDRHPISRWAGHVTSGQRSDVSVAMLNGNRNDATAPPDRSQNRGATREHDAQVSTRVSDASDLIDLGPSDTAGRPSLIKLGKRPMPQSSTLPQHDCSVADADETLSTGDDQSAGQPVNGSSPGQARHGIIGQERQAQSNASSIR